MPIDRTLAAAEEKWIAKYRTASKEVPVSSSPFANARALVRDALSSLFFVIAKARIAKASRADTPRSGKGY
jgi:hypothetical protein